MRRYGPLVFPGLALAGFLTGCASPAIMIASQMVDGVSYLATGKSTTDHALSGALDEDCALHRALDGAAVCKKKSREPASDIQTASLADAPVTLPDGPDGAMETLSEDTPDVLVGNEVGSAVDQKTGEVPDQASQASQALGQASGQSVQVSRGFGADMFFVPHHAGDVDDRAKNKNSKNKNLGGDTPAIPGTGDVGPESNIAAVPDQAPSAGALAPGAVSPARHSAGEPDKRFFIVLGSFSTRSNAQLAAGQMPNRVAPVLASHQGPRIAVADVRGRTFYRVILGPLDQPSTRQARRQFVAAGLGNTWTIAACGGVISTGCVAGH
jgi:hypothetical protein